MVMAEQDELQGMRRSRAPSDHPGDILLEPGVAMNCGLGRGAIQVSDDRNFVELGRPVGERGLRRYTRWIERFHMISFQHGN